jgi:hypothetical protein
MRLFLLSTFTFGAGTCRSSVPRRSTSVEPLPTAIVHGLGGARNVTRGGLRDARGVIFVDRGALGRALAGHEPEEQDAWQTAIARYAFHVKLPKPSLVNRMSESARPPTAGAGAQDSQGYVQASKIQAKRTDVGDDLFRHHCTSGQWMAPGGTRPCGHTEIETIIRSPFNELRG